MEIGVLPLRHFFLEEPYVIITQGNTKQPHVNNSSVYVTAAPVKDQATWNQCRFPG